MNYPGFNWQTVEKKLLQRSQGSFNIADIALGTKHPEKIAFNFVDENLKNTPVTYLDLQQESSQFANLLQSLDVKAEDRVFIFLPRIKETVVSFLGILKIRAIAGVMFAAFGEQALLDRLQDSQAKVLVTHHSLLDRIENIRHQLAHLEKIIVVGPTGNPDFIDYASSLHSQSKVFTTVTTQPDDLAFILYTSGSTGKPKGIVHSHRAIWQEYATAKEVLQLTASDNFWCTADFGWITGISYTLFGPLTTESTSLVFAGGFAPATWYHLIEKFQISCWYTAPTALRMLMAQENEVLKHHLGSLKRIYSVGEPLNPEVILWGQKAFQQTIFDTWFQTELGAITIANYPHLSVRVGSMGKPVLGFQATILDPNQNRLPPNHAGMLALRPNQMSLMKTVWQNPTRFDKYFADGWYITGDSAYQDTDGYFWFVGRDDDIINTSGERVGPFEVESALISHPAVVEAGVIGKPDELRGEIIKAFVVLHPGYQPSPKLEADLKSYVKSHLSAHEYPREIEFVTKLPKTRSGKIMRRVLKSQELNLPVGDLSTAEDY